MTILQIASFESCGKTALCAGIGKKLINSGRKVGYIKPVNIVAAASDGCIDAGFVKEALELSEDSTQLYVINASQEELWHDLSEDAEKFSMKVKSACNSIAACKDILILESPGSLKNDKVATLACYTIAENVNSQVILLLCGSSDYRDAEIKQVVDKLGNRLAGVVLNCVPEGKYSRVKAECEEYFKSMAVNVLGVLPENRALLGVSVKEIEEAMEGQIISCQQKEGDLVENVMLGAMTPDSAKEYFARRNNKAVITRAERPDMQLAALETSTRCLIVTGKRPSAPVIVKAEDKRVPVVVVEKEIEDIIRGIEQALANTKFCNLHKLAVFMPMLENSLDFGMLGSKLAI